MNKKYCITKQYFNKISIFLGLYLSFEEVGMYLLRLIYYSRNTVKAMTSSAGNEIKSIMESCQRNNPSLGVTGALIFNDQYFAQVLEGDRKAVTSIFTKISNDKRHNEIVLLEAKPVDARLFSDGWSMAYAGHSDKIDTLYLKYGIAVGFTPAKMSANTLTSFIYDMVSSDAKVAHHAFIETSKAKSVREIRV